MAIRFFETAVATIRPSEIRIWSIKYLIAKVVLHVYLLSRHHEQHDRDRLLGHPRAGGTQSLPKDEHLSRYLLITKRHTVEHTLPRLFGNCPSSQRTSFGSWLFAHSMQAPLRMMCEYAGKDYVNHGYILTLTESPPGYDISEWLKYALAHAEVLLGCRRDTCESALVMNALCTS